MSTSRIILEMGTGNDLYGEDYTKAACRAVQDALHHSSLVLYRSLELDPKDMEVNVTIGVQEPGKIDHAAIAVQLPYGKVNVSAVKGGLNVQDEQNDTLTVIASAAVEARYPLPSGKYRLSRS